MLGLNKKNLERLLKFMPTTRDYREQLKVVNVTQDKKGFYTASATNGYALLQITMPDENNHTIPDETVKPLSGEVNIAGETIKRLSKIVKRPTKKDMPEAEKVYISSEGLHYNNLKNDHQSVNIEAKKAFVATKFPDLDKVYPKGNKFKKISLNAGLLGGIAKAMENQNANIITLTLYEDTNKPLVIEAMDGDVELKALLMPIRRAE